MNEVLMTSDFSREYKQLRKKYRSLVDSLNALIDNLAIDGAQGVEISPNIYKIRVPIAEKNKGKRSGARIITYLRIENGQVWLLHIYDKSEINDLPDHIIAASIKRLLEILANEDEKDDKQE